jgi:prolipoprotein diacylglyceryltransferase
MLAYAIGRIGCQVSGDGDWGILNSALISNSQAQLMPAAPEQFNSVLQANRGFYAQQFATFENIQYLHIKPFWGLPDWFFGYNFPHNVINEGLSITGCDGNYCHYLPISVFPTSFYETIVCLILFGLLWFLRKKINIAGRVFAIYLIVNGIERFIIEKIRVNTKYDILFHPTQAEIISSLLIIVGLTLYWYAPKLKTVSFEDNHTEKNV